MRSVIKQIDHGRTRSGEIRNRVNVLVWNESIHALWFVFLNDVMSAMEEEMGEKLR